ncbi:MAG: hypothetical protein AAF443_08320 [Chlamydiota bacterium]
MKKFEIVHETEKAYLIKKEGIKFWICKAWLLPSGELNEGAKKAFEKAKKEDMSAREAAKKTESIQSIDINSVLEQERSIAREKASLDIQRTVWLNELTKLVSLLFAHTKRADPSNQIYAIDVWGRIEKAMKTKK